VSDGHAETPGGLNKAHARNKGILVGGSKLNVAVEV